MRRAVLLLTCMMVGLSPGLPAMAQQAPPQEADVTTLKKEVQETTLGEMRSCACAEPDGSAQPFTSTTIVPITTRQPRTRRAWLLFEVRPRQSLVLRIKIIRPPGSGTPRAGAATPTRACYTASTMNSNPFSRRRFMRTSLVASAAIPLSLRAQDLPASRKEAAQSQGDDHPKNVATL